MDTGVAFECASSWPRYAEAVTGFREYWYPVAWSKAVRKKPLAVQLLDESIFLIREAGRVHALTDRCPHRGVPLSIGRREFSGTWTCRYHGWTFDTETGALKAAITDGPDSPICGKVRVKTYPVEERAGLVWVYMGDEPPPPVETDIPREFLYPDSIVVGRIMLLKGNWRTACDAAFDEGHAKYLHRYGAVFTLFKLMPAWSKIRIIRGDDGWITRDTLEVRFEDKYGELGHWPKKSFWKRPSAYFQLSARLPCMFRNEHQGKHRANFVWLVPVGPDRYRNLFLYVTRARGLRAFAFRLSFRLYFYWAHVVQFSAQDAWMVELMPDSTPARLYRPDVSLAAWRTLCEEARGISTLARGPEAVVGVASRPAVEDAHRGSAY